MALTKAHIVRIVAAEAGLTKARSVEVVEQLLGIMKSALASGDDVLISNFGKFGVRDKRARIGRNPATEESMLLKSRRVVTFKCSGKLRQKCNDDKC